MLVNQLGGSLTAQSSQEEGIAFTIRLSALIKNEEARMNGA